MPLPWTIRDRHFNWGERTYLMGVLNVTPDSFSDGGLFDSVANALAQVERLVPYIDLLDIGGESTRPGALPVAINQELERVLPAIAAIRARYPQLPISIDTTKASVAEQAIQAGADLINDVSAGRFDPNMLEIAAKYQVPTILMHMQGLPQSMQSHPHYGNVTQEVQQFLIEALKVAEAFGLPRHLIAIDPGIGFGKTMDHNLELLRSLPQLTDIGLPLVIGVSRKSFIGKLLDQPEATERVWGTAAACTVAIAGGADILRVHDPQEIKDVCLVADAVYRKY